MDSEALGELQARIAARVAQSRAERAAFLATMPEFGAFLDALNEAGIGYSHVSVTDGKMSIEWGERCRQADPYEPPLRIYSVSEFNAALAAGAIPITRAKRWKGRHVVGS